MAKIKKRKKTKKGKGKGSIKQKSPSRVALVDQVDKYIADLAKHGWREVFAQHGLDIKAASLREELLRPLEGVNRECPGFEDFSSRGNRGIEPGRPAESLLFHAFASPHVLTYRIKGKDHQITKFPTPACLEAIENLVYGIQPPTIDELRVTAQGAPLAIVVFSKEYRTAINTVHRMHADMCFARTGVARVGTAASEYLPDARGYLPYDKKNDNAIRILPSRYGAYVAALVPGQKDGHGPMRFIEDQSNTPSANPPSDKIAGTSSQDGKVAKGDRGDQARRFWVPMHKLFSGTSPLFLR